MPGRALKVCGGGGCVGGVVVESEFNDQLWLSFRLAKPKEKWKLIWRVKQSGVGNCFESHARVILTSCYLL